MIENTFSGRICKFRVSSSFPSLNLKFHPGIMHQTPFACLVSPGGGAFEIFARYVLKVLKFFIFILFSFFKNN